MKKFSEIACRIADEAVSLAGQSGVMLDYTAESVKGVDEVLENYHENIEEYGGEDGEKTLWNTAVIFGAYIGEVLLRQGLSEKGFTWAEDEGFPILSTQDGKMTASPITKVQKRIHNGAEDSLERFVEVVLFAVAEGSLPKTGVLRVPDVETASGLNVEKTVLNEADTYMSLVAEGREDFVIFKSHDGFFQFYGFKDRFVCETWFNLGGRRAYAIINPDCVDTGRVELATPFGRYTPKRRHIISLKQLKAALNEYFHNIEEADFLEKVPWEKIEM